MMQSFIWIQTILVMSDIKELWDHFKEFNSSQLMGLAPNDYNEWYINNRKRSRYQNRAQEILDCF